MVPKRWHSVIGLLCAWILWHEHETYSVDAGPRHWWETPSAYSTRSECEAAKERVFTTVLKLQQERASEQADVGVTSVPTNIIVLSAKDFSMFSWTQKFTCLPDTVNPKE